jgi:hypothetical protein
VRTLQSKTAQWCRQSLLAAVGATVDTSPQLSLETLQHSESKKNGSYSAVIEVVEYQPAHPNPDLEKLRLLISFGEHAREFISSETGLHVLRLLAESRQLAWQLQNSFPLDHAQQILDLLDCCVHVMVRTSTSNFRSHLGNVAAVVCKLVVSVSV